MKTKNSSDIWRGQISRRALIGASATVAVFGFPTFDARAQMEKPTPKRGGILKVSAYLNPTRLDPVTGNGGQDQVFLWAMFDTLIDFEPQTMKPRPGLANWSYPDSKTMVLELNPGITFHDGTPCDAEAVRWNLDRFMNGARSSAKPDLASVASIEVGGPLKVVLHLKNPDTALPVILSERCGMMSSPKAVKEAGDDYDRRPCGTGPFKFVSWADADRIIVTRNENYWKKDGPLLDGITFRIITDYAAGARSVVAGENDFMYLVPPRLFKNLSADKNLTVIKAPSMRTMNLFFNYGRGPLQDVRVRQAINYAIDRKGFARVTTDGTGAASGSLIVPQHWAADAASMDRYPLDLEKAKRLLAEAGLEKGFELSMVVLPDAEYRKRAEIVTDNLKKIGITVNMMPVQQANATFLADKKGDMYLVAWPGKPDMTQTYNLVFSKSSFYNPAGITPVENIEQLVDATRMSEDVGERKAAFAKLINAEREAALFAPICSEQLVYAMRTKVKGFEPNLLGKPKFDGVYLDT